MNVCVTCHGVLIVRREPNLRAPQILSGQKMTKSKLDSIFIERLNCSNEKKTYHLNDIGCIVVRDVFFKIKLLHDLP
jgi:hypothetical protein